MSDYQEKKEDHPSGTNISSDVESRLDIPTAPEQNKEEEARNLRGFKWALTVVSILSCVFLFALDTTVVADIQPNIIDELGEFEKFPWLATAYAIPAVALALIESKLFGLFDIKWMYIGFTLLFEIGSAISGAAPTMNSLIAGRMIAGIGGCGMYIGSLTFFSVLTTPKERPMYIASIVPVWGIGTVLGPIVGGALAESSVGWRWGFYINLFIFCATGPAMLLLLPSKVFTPGTIVERLLQIDWLGLTIWAGWSVSFFMAIVFGGALFPWDSYTMIVLWVFVGVTMFGFLLSHRFHPFVSKENRLYPSHMLRVWKVNILQICTFCASAAMYIPIYYIPLFFQYARGESPVQAAVRLLPFVFMIAFMSTVQGAAMAKLGYYMPWFLTGGILALTGGTLMFTVNPDTATPAIYGYSVLIGLGAGSCALAAFGCVAAFVAPEETFNAIGALTVAQVVGITFFPSVAGCLFQNLGAQELAKVVPASFVGNPRDLLAGARGTAFLSLPIDIQERVVDTIISTMSSLYVMVIATGAIIVITSPWLGLGKIPRDSATSH